MCACVCVRVPHGPLPPQQFRDQHADAVQEASAPLGASASQVAMLSSWVQKTGVKSASQAFEEGLEKEKSEARRLGVTYPAPKRKPGRVSRQLLYLELIDKKLRTHRWDELAKIHDGVVPGWWQKGMDLKPPVGMSHKAHESVPGKGKGKGKKPALEQDDLQHVIDVPMEEEDEDEEPEVVERKKKKQKQQKVHLPRVLQAWFLTWSAMMLEIYKISDDSLLGVGCELDA